MGTSGPAMAATTTYWSNFPAVSGEDRIELYESLISDPQSIQVCLEAASYITWWKQLKFLDWNGGDLGSVYTQDGNHGPNCMERRVSDIRQLEIWKAKAFGAHTHMYTLHYNQVALKAGKKIVFRWVRD
jgi:hypothetical protein